MTKLTAKDAEKIQEQIESAGLVIKNHGYTIPAVVNFHKTTPAARIKNFGFNFDETKAIGDSWIDERGFYWEVVAIVTP